MDAYDEMRAAMQGDDESAVDPLVIPIEGFLGILAAAMEGRIAPRWLCMSEEAKLKYIEEGKALFERFLQEELAAKRAREAGNPRAFFAG